MTNTSGTSSLANTAFTQVINSVQSTFSEAQNQRICDNDSLLKCDLFLDHFTANVPLTNLSFARLSDGMTISPPDLATSKTTDLAIKSSSSPILSLTQFSVTGICLFQ